MDKNRRVRSRRGAVLLGEKDRQKRPGTPHRNRIQRPPNLIRMTESAAPVHTSYQDYSENDDEPDADVLRKESKPFNCSLQPQFQRINLAQIEENANTNINQESTSSDETLVTDPIGRFSRTKFEHSRSKEYQIEQPLNSLTLKQDIPVRLTTSVCIPKETSEIRSQGKSNEDLRRHRQRQGQNQSKFIPSPIERQNHASNTASTPTPSGCGLPLLEGIHAGVGIGPAFSEIGHDYNETLSGIYNLDHLEDLDLEGDENDSDLSMVHHRIQVPKSVVFDHSVGSRHAFGGIIKLDNLSNHFMTFCIKSSEPEMFSMFPKVGLMNPKESQDIIIKTNPKYDFTFQDISGEIFKVFATPVYTRKQMEDEKLEVLWRAFGTKFFPRIAAEEHTIDFIYRYHTNYTKDSVLSVISSNHRWLSSIWGNCKDVQVKEIDNPISEEEFYNSWPLEDDQYNFMSCRNQLDGWFWFLRKVKREMRQVKYELRQCIGGFFMIIFVFLVVFSSIFSTPAFNRMAEPFLDWFRSFQKENAYYSRPTASPSIFEQYWSKTKEYLISLGIPVPV